MSGETESRPSGWSVDTLKENLENELCAVRKQIGESDRRYEQRFDGQEKATNVALQSAKEAVTKAENATEKRFESVNEFRAALGDQSKDLLPRTEYNNAHQSVVEKIDSAITRIAAMENQNKGSDITKSDIYRAVGLGFGAVGAVLGMLTLLANGVFK